MFRKSIAVFLGVFLGVFLVSAMVVPSAQAYDEALAKKLNDVLIKGLSEGNWQVNADVVNSWIKEKKNDFLVVDVRPAMKMYKAGHVPGAIFIPYNQILQPENLKKLPKDKKIVLYCVTGQTQNLPVVALRALGYDARVMSFGYTAWGKGYWGGGLMNKAMGNAAQKNFPVEK